MIPFRTYLYVSLAWAFGCGALCSATVASLPSDLAAGQLISLIEAIRLEVDWPAEAGARPGLFMGHDRWLREMPGLLGRTLRSHRADLRSPQGFTALQAACLYRQAELIEDLLRRGADPNARPDGWEAMGRAGDAPLGLLLGNGSLPLPLKERLARLLLDHGADPEGPMISFPADGRDRRIFRTSPFLTLRDSKNDVLRLLLLQYGEQDMRLRWPERQRIAVGLSADDSIAVVQKLLDGGFDPNVAGEKGITPLWLAMMNGDLAMMRLLLDHGADPNRRSRYFSPPLFRLNAGYSGKKRTLDDMLTMARLLLAHGADRHALDNSGRSLLRFYRQTGGRHAEELISFFRERGAVLDPDAPGMREPLKARVRQVVPVHRTNALWSGEYAFQTRSFLL